MVFPNLDFVLLLAFLSLISCLLSGSKSHALLPGLIFYIIWDLMQMSTHRSQQFLSVTPETLFWSHKPITTVLLQTTFSPVPLKESLCREDLCRIMLILNSLHYLLQWELRSGKTFLKQIFDKDRWSWHSISRIALDHSHSYTPKEHKHWCLGPLIAEN